MGLETTNNKDGGPLSAEAASAADSLAAPARSKSFLRRIAPIGLSLLAVWLFGFGGGYLAGKKKWVDLSRVRAAPLSELSRNLEYRVPGYGDLLQKYRNWERPKLYRYIFSGQGGKAMILVFFNNWVMANLTMIVRTATVIPLVLYPYGRFVQGLTLAQTPATLQITATLVCEFGGYLLTIFGTLCVMVWVLAFRRFGFASRRSALGYGAATFLGCYALSGFFLLIGSYLETMAVIGMSMR